MSYQVLSRKWRPTKFSEVIGQEHITRSLQNALLRDRLGHAYLLTGTRGIGKTSVARLFAKSLRCENLSTNGDSCGICRGCEETINGNSLNVFEIDGASNNSVDDIRDLIQTVSGLPTFGNYKVYIIDEVHMLSTNAFNALLKTLEEPPAHVIFILATTEPHKLLGTVLSRCLRFDFRNASVETLIAHLKTICEREKIEYENEAQLRLICEMGEGSFRDTLSLLDQVLSFSGDNKIAEDVLALSLGVAKASAIGDLVSNLLKCNEKDVLKSYREILSENITVQNICRDIQNRLYEIISTGSYEQLGVAKAEVFWVYEALVKDFEWAMQSMMAERVVSIVLQKVASRHTFFEGKSTIEKVGQEAVPAKKKYNWKEFLNFIRERSPALWSNLEHGNILGPDEFDPDSPVTISLGIAFPANAKVFLDYLNEVETKDKLISFFKEYLGGSQNNIEMELHELKSDVEDFKTIIEIEEDKINNIKEQRKSEIAGHALVKHAEKIFDSKIDKIKLKN